jgi:hypothetical protein
MVSIVIEGLFVWFVWLSVCVYVFVSCGWKKESRFEEEKKVPYVPFQALSLKVIAVILVTNILRHICFSIMALPSPKRRLPYCNVPRSISHESRRQIVLHPDLSGCPGSV